MARMLQNKCLVSKYNCELKCSGHDSVKAVQNCAAIDKCLC